MAERDTLHDELKPRHEAVADYGRALIALDEIGRYLRSEMRGDVAELANLIAAKVREQQLEFERRVEAKLDLLIATVRPFAQRLTALESEHCRNHPICLHSVDTKEAE